MAKSKNSKDEQPYWKLLGFDSPAGFYKFQKSVENASKEDIGNADHIDDCDDTMPEPDFESDNDVCGECKVEGYRKRIAESGSCLKSDIVPEFNLYDMDDVEDLWCDSSLSEQRHEMDKMDREERTDMEDDVEFEGWEPWD